MSGERKQIIVYPLEAGPRYRGHISPVNVLRCRIAAAEADAHQAAVASGHWYHRPVVGRMYERVAAAIIDAAYSAMARVVTNAVMREAANG